MNQHMRLTMPQCPRIAVRIANRNRCNAARVACCIAVAVADAFTCRQLFDLGNDGTQRTDLLQFIAEYVAAVNAIKAKSKTHHIKMQMRMPQDTGSITEMPDWCVA